MTLERRSVNLSLMLEQIADEFAPMLRERGLACAVSAPPGVMLNCDRTNYSASLTISCATP